MTKTTNEAHKNILNVDIPNYREIVSADMINDIRAIAYFKKSQYSNLNIPDTLEFYTDRYVLQLFDFININKNSIIVDIGTGFGWLSMCFAFLIDAQIVAIDVDKKRLAAGKEIADILGVGHKINWCVANLSGQLPIKTNTADVVYCVEVLEHVFKNENAICDLCRISSNLLIITTPNLWFPVIAHDTMLPFCHWLPIPIRKMYANLFRKGNVENNNLFWSPLSLKKNMKGFKPVSRWLHYSSFDKYLDTFPFYLPYGKGKYVNKIGRAKVIYYNIVSKFGIYSHFLVPSLSYVFKKNNS